MVSLKMSTIKVVLSSVLLCSLTSCGWFDRKVSAITGEPTEICKYGVVYLQFTSGASVAYNKDGTIRTCN